MIIILLIVSLLINPILSNISYGVMTFTIFTSLLSIIVLYPYLKINRLIIYSTIIGMLFDIVYSSFYINFILYPIIALIIHFIFKALKFNIINIIIITSFIVFIYNSIIYLVLNILNMQVISYSYFISKLVFIYLFNSVYVLISYLLLNLFKVKKYIK